MHRPVLGFSPPRQRQGHQRGPGFTLVEPLVYIVLMTIVVSGAAMLLTVSNRGTTGSRAQGQLAVAIDSDLDGIKQLSDRFTCCTGTCLVGPPPASQVGSDKLCATSNPQQDEYFFPQRAITLTETSATTYPEPEPDRVDYYCDSAQNTVFLSPLKRAIDSLSLPGSSGLWRGSTIRDDSNGLPDHLIQVTYRDGSADGRILRVVNIVPPMANWCS